MADTKIYEVKEIDFCNLTIEASETNLTIADVPENEVFPIEEFGEFKIRLINGDSGETREVLGDVVDFAEWLRNRGGVSR